MQLWRSVVGVLATLASLVPAAILSDRRDKPQRMWDPGKGSLLGHAVASFGLENVTVSNQTAQLGSTAFLHCRVRNLAHQHVSWLRRRDYHLLTSGLHTYSRDERFGVVRSEDSDDWTLQIKFVQRRDEGPYECQVSTRTGRYGYLVNLDVVVPEAMIAGSAERHVQSGSTISLLCIIQGSLEAPQFILWYHNNQMVNYDLSRGGTTVTMDHHDPTTSRLTITTATVKDTGNYTCSAANTVPASINVFVSQGKGDKTAAIQRLGSGSWSLMAGPGILVFGGGGGGVGVGRVGVGGYFNLPLLVAVCWRMVLAVLLYVTT